MGGSLVSDGVRASAQGGRATGRPSFEAVYAEARPSLVRVAYLAIGSHAVAEELVQEAFVRLHVHFDRVDNPGGFLHTTLVRLCLTWQKRRSLEIERLATLPGPEPTGEPVVDATWEALRRIQPERRLVLVLRYYEDLSHKDIARLIGCPVATVRSRVRRGLVDLRKELEG
jgi:RNA polymerase sigma factor (sigma-70 family)